MKNLLRIMKMSKGFLGKFIFTLFLALIGTAMQVATPFIIGQTIDLMITGNFSAILEKVITLVILYALSEIISYVVNLLSFSGAQSAMKTLRENIFEKLMKLPYATLDSFKTGDLVMRINQDVDNIAYGVTQGLLSFVRGFGVVLFTIIVMLSLNLAVALSVIVLTPLSILIAYFITRNSQKYFKAHAKKMSELTAFTEEHMANQEQILLGGSEETSSREFETLVKEWKPTSDLSHFFSALINPSSRLVNNTIYVIAGLIGVLIKLSVGEISTFLLYSNQYAKPFNEITAVIGDLQNASSSADRIIELLDNENAPENSAKTLSKSNHSVSFENVSFSYSKERPLITDFSFTAKKGEKIAIVGFTGAGKTTLINLILRFYDVDEGEVKIDGINVKDLSYKALRSNITVVLQDSYIERAAVKDNIAFGKALSDEEIEIISKKARAFDFISSLPQGFDTVIDQDDLSLGEAQLLCIARAMAEDSSILILDEATSAIDSLTEVLVQEAFSELMKGKTTFIIAHRLSTIRNADKILVMEKGDVVEIGSHDELIEMKGLYHKLYTIGFSD